MTIIVAEIIKVEDYGIDNSCVTLNAGYDRGSAKARIAAQRSDCLRVIVWIVHDAAVQRRNGVNRSNRQPFALPLIGSVKESLVLDDRSAN